MNKQNLNDLESELEKKQSRKTKRKRPKMKVGGVGVKQLGKIIAERGSDGGRPRPGK